ncbi:MAG: Plug domain-containing protein, partial [Pseudomonadales bacterium]|nr:Plug domain-containing protein [Pseudomonadales bacterium]
MRIRNIKSRRRALFLGVLMANMASVTFAQQENSVEEVVVTGSYIRGSALDAPSPVQVIDRASIEAQGASTVWDLIRNLDINQGSATNVNGSAGDSAGISGSAQVNLRNLGGNSTLTLINGKRVTPSAVLTIAGQEFVDLNDIPVTMTERIEILTDGGSALYGSDAVAGVVNVIMRTEFEGLELYGETQGIAEEGGTYEETLSAIWGWESSDGRTNFVISGEYFERDPVGIEHGNTYDPNRWDFVDEVGFATAPFGPGINPIYVNQELTDLRHAERASIGLAPTGTEYTDPLCGTVPGTFTDTRFDDFGNPESQCMEDITDLNFLAQGQERKAAAISFEHDFNDRTEFYSF